MTSLIPQVVSRGPTAVRANTLKMRALRVLDDLPPFSPIMNRLLASLAGEDISFNKLGDLIEKDTVIAGNLLHVVNSALYARRNTVTSVRHAVSVLGVAKVRNVILGMSVANMWTSTKVPANWSMKRFDMHSAGVAILSDLLAQHVPVPYPEGAFVAGLFHDLGQLLIAIGLPREREAILRCAEVGSGGMVGCEEGILGFSHAELSRAALGLWRLPDPVLEAVALHHAAWGSGAADMTLGRLVDAANQFVNATGDSIAQNTRFCSTDPDRIAHLGLEPERLDRVLAEFREEYATMMGFFS